MMKAALPRNASSFGATGVKYALKVD